MLIEARAFPRHRIEATLPSSVHSLLDALGARAAIADAGFLRARPPRILWPIETAFADPARQQSGFGLHIDRGRFDAILLKNARDAGVRILQPAYAAAPVKCRETNRWRTHVTCIESDMSVRSRLFIDASGRQVGGGQQTRMGVPTIALYAYFDRTPDDDVSAIEACRDGWIWRAPVGNRSAVVAIFIDPAHLPRRHRNAVCETYDALLAGSRLGRSLGTRKDDKVVACNATSRSALVHGTCDLLKIGDANLTLDPLSSQGIQQALASALQAAIIANTILARPSMAASAAQFYDDRQTERRQHHQRLARAQYARIAGHFSSDFWVKRSQGQNSEDNQRPVEYGTPQLASYSLNRTKISLACGVTIGMTQAIDGNFVILKKGVLRNEMRPLVYVGNIEVAALLQSTTFHRTATEILADWSSRMPTREARSIFASLLIEKVLSPTPIC
jgi:flavin-dependent dehydrogenase